jgi:hypothetical protein
MVQRIYLLHSYFHLFDWIESEDEGDVYLEVIILTNSMRENETKGYQHIRNEKEGERTLIVDLAITVEIGLPNHLFDFTVRQLFTYITQSHLVSIISIVILRVGDTHQG